MRRIDEAWAEYHRLSAQYPLPDPKAAREDDDWIDSLAATDFYQVLETSDLPDGVVNIVTGSRTSLAKTLAEHDEVDGLWFFGPRDVATAVERYAADNMKRTWTDWTRRDWTNPAEGEGRDFLRFATQVKNILIPYGE